MSHGFSDEYTTAELQITIGHLQVRIVRATNVDELFDRLVAKGETHEDVVDERIPYWAELWPSGIGLAHFLAGLPMAGTTVTELGCGLGLSGIVAGMLGAEVTLTDYLDEAVQFAEYNWSLNCTHPATFKRLDWREPDPSVAADWLIASDITYEKRYFQYLPAAFRTMCKPGGKILVSDPRRHVSGAFFDALPAQGFKVEKHTLIVPSLVSGKENPIDVYVIME